MRAVTAMPWCPSPRPVHFSISTLSNAFFGINIREMKSESGFSLAMASQPL